MALITTYKLAQGCADCGEMGLPAYCYDFDHRDPSEKRAGVTTLASSGKSIKMIEAEIAKCDVVCANCHRIRTHSEPPSSGLPKENQ